MATDSFLNLNFSDSTFGHLDDDIGVPKDVIWKEESVS